MTRPQHVNAGEDAQSAAPRGARSFFAAIMVVAAVLRLLQLNAQSLSMDEVKDLEIARSGWTAMQTSEDRFPPLYHLMLGAWLKAVPWDETGRGLSVLCGVLTVAAVGALARTVAGPAAGLWAAAIAAVAPFAVWYSLEARAYGLYLLLATVALWQFTAAMKLGRRDSWTWFAAASITGAYTHYYFGLIVAIAGLLYVASVPRGNQLRRGLAAFAAIAIAGAPVLWFLQQDLDQPWGYAQSSKFSLGSLAYTYFSYLSGYTLGPSLRELHTLSPREAALTAAPWIALLAAIVVVASAQAWVVADPSERTRLAAGFAAFGLAPPAIIGVVSRVAGVGYNIRHAVWAAVLLVVVLAIGLARGRPRRLSVLTAGLLMGAFAVTHFNRLFASAHRTEDARAVAEYVTHAGPRSPVFVLSGYMAKPLAVYLPRDWPVHALPDAAAEADVGQDAVDAVRDLAAPGRRFWLAYSRQFHGDPRGTALALLTDKFALKPEADFAGFRVYVGWSR
jgi:hypothetical protein